MYINIMQNDGVNMCSWQNLDATVGLVAAFNKRRCDRLQNSVHVEDCYERHELSINYVYAWGLYTCV
jgi:hypothetical protein